MDHVSLATSNREKRRALRLRSSTTDINRDVVEQRSQRPLNGESSTPVIKPTHSRNQSQDSTHSLESEQVHHERSTDRYFQRISLVIGKKSSSFDHTLVVESGRGVLYSFTQLYKVIRNSILCTGEDQLSAQFAPVLSECNLGMQKLMASLESADAVLMAGKALDPWLASELLQNSISAISQFHRLVSVVRLRIGGILAALDARLGRHLILNLHGVIAEMATAWHSLMSLENHSSSLGSMSTCSFESPQSPLAATVSETTGIPPLKITPIPYISRPNTPTAHKANRARSQSDNVHLSPSSPWPATPTVPLPIGRSADVDAQLYTSLQTAAQTGIFALGKLLDTFEEFLDKLGPEQSDPLLPQQPGLEGDFVRPGVGGLDRKLRDVIRQLHVALDITKRWQKSVLLVSKNEEGGNTASISLAAIVACLTSIKQVSTQHEPILPKSVKSYLSSVTRTTTDVTRLWALSSFAEEGYSLGKEANGNGPMMNTFTPSVLSPSSKSFPVGMFESFTDSNMPPSESVEERGEGETDGRVC